MSLSKQALKRAAACLLKGRSIPPSRIGRLPVDCQPSDEEDAMAIQDELHDLLTAAGKGTVVGTKIGCTTSVMQKFLGMTRPCSGAIFESTLRQVEGCFDFDSFLHVGVECEIAAVLDSAIEAAAAPHTLDRIFASVRAVFPAIEIVDDRYVDFVAREPDWRTWVADDFFGAGLVLGEPVPDWRSVDLPSVRGVMRINGCQVGTGYGRDIINGHPLEALVWLANAEAARGRDIPANWIVSLGSVVQTKWVTKGDIVDVEIKGLGTAVARFE